jgi:hypothetical protein
MGAVHSRRFRRCILTFLDLVQAGEAAVDALLDPSRLRRVEGHL